MKKFTICFLLALLTSAGINASEKLDMPSPWDSSCTLNGNTYTFNGNYSGAGTWLGEADMSAYDCCWIQYTNCTASISFGVTYNKVTGHESWGDVYLTDAATIDAGDAGVVKITLDKTTMSDTDGKTCAENIRQVQLQDQGSAASLTVVGIWFGTEEEYQEFMSGNAPQRSDLLVSAMNAGWSASDDGEGGITITGSYGARGWAWWNGGKDFSNFDYFVVRFYPPTAQKGQVFIQDANEQNHPAPFNQKCLQCVVALPEGVNISQICIQGTNAGDSYYIQEAFVCTSEYVEENGLKDEYYIDRKDLGLSASDLSSGWGGSTYDATTKTITIGDNWSGKGWWKSTTDYSDYDKLVIHFADATPNGGNIVVEFDNNTPSQTEPFNEFCIQRVFALDADGKNAVKQIYIQGPAGTKYELEEAYVCTNEYADIQVGLSDEYASFVEIPFNSYGYATFFYTDHAYIIPNGVEAFTITGISNKELQEEAVEGLIPASSAVVLRGEPGTVAKFGESVKTPEEIPYGFLQGQVREVTMSDDNLLFYILSAKNGNVGFFFQNEGGHSVTCAPHKAVLVLTPEEAASATGFIFDAADGITAVEQTTEYTNGNIYNIAGQRVNASFKGLVIENGVKRIKK